MKLNSKIIASLGVDLPEDLEEESTIPVPDPVHPSELVLVNNPNLPEMEDIESSLVEGERQLERLIQKGFELIDDMGKENASLEPRFRNTHLERLVMLFQATSDIVKFKNELQLKKKTSRLNDAKFVGRGSGKDPEQVTVVNQTNNFMFKDIVNQLRQVEEEVNFENVSENAETEKEP